MSKNIIVEMQTGSYVYGTNIATSDKDYKSIVLPSAREIVLQRIKNTDNNNNFKKVKNTAGDVDKEYYSLNFFITMLLEGQTGAMDMIFTPDKFIVTKTELWDKIKSQKELFFSKDVSAYVGYCKSQAAKYGMKGTRLSAIRQAIGILSRFTPYCKLSNHEEALNDDITDAANRYLAITLLKDQAGRDMTPYLEVCGKKYSFNLTFSYVIGKLTEFLSDFGTRALAAEQNEGIDWKALMHAVRVADEAVEFLTTGNLCFPRPNASWLRQVRQGLIPYKEVSEMIELSIQKIDEAKIKSNLPDKPDRVTADNLIFEIYKDVIIKEVIP